MFKLNFHRKYAFAFPSLIHRRRMSSGSTKKPTFRILAIGDSLTWGYYNRGFGQKPYTMFLSMMLRGLISNKIEIDNYGFNGEISSDMAKRLPNYLQIAENEKNPYKMMLLLGGTNDLDDYTSDSILNNLMKMHQLAEEKGIYSVAMTLPRNQNDGHRDLAHFNDTRRKVNHFLREHFKGRVVDLEAAIPLDAKDSNGNSLWDDSLHFSPAGYLRMAELVYDTVKDTIIRLDAGESTQAVLASQNQNHSQSSSSQSSLSSS